MDTNAPPPHNQKLLAYFTAAATPLYLVNSTRTIEYCNAATAEWVGLTESELLGRSVAYHSEAKSEQGQPSLMTGLCPPPAVLAGSNGVATVSALGRDGRLRHRSAQFLVLPDPQSGEQSILAICGAHDLSPQELSASQSTEPTTDYLHAALTQFRQQAKQHSSPLLLGDSPTACSLRRKMEAATASRANVLLVGDHAAERTELARALFYNGQPGPNARLVPLDAALLSAELFSERISLAVRAAGAADVTLLVENSEALSDEAQLTVAEALREYPLLRVICTSCEEGFDFQPTFHSAAVTLTIKIPKIIERTEDLELLTQWCVEQCNADGDKQIGGLSPAAMDRLRLYAWPGGTAQLQQAISEAHSTCQAAIIDAGDLPTVIQHAEMASEIAGKDATQINLADYLAKIERELVLRALDTHGGNKSDAAKALGLTRPRLYRRLASLGLEQPEEDAPPEPES